MTDKATLLALAEQCEAAERGSLELNTAIFRALKPEYAGPEWQLYGGGLRHVNDGSDARCLPPPERTPGYYTSSLDAAMTLVPEGWDPQICKGPMFCMSANDTRPWGVSLIGNDREVEGEFGPEMAYDSHDANAATAPLALTAACLRARAATL